MNKKVKQMSILKNRPEDIKEIKRRNNYFVKLSLKKPYEKEIR